MAEETLESAGISSQAASSAIAAAPPTANFLIDDENFCNNGETYFNIADVKNLVRLQNPQNPSQSVIIFNFVGSQIAVNFGDKDDRDAVFTEVTRRMFAVKTNGMKEYIKRQKLEANAAKTDAIHAKGFA